jgi:putative transcriptional regulator
MTITHHLDDATLMSFAAGALPAALAAVAAAHVAMCQRCRAEVADLERVGGALLASLPAVPLGRAGPAQPPPAGAPGRPRRPVDAADGEVPKPVARLVQGGLDAVAWRWLGPGVWDHLLPVAGKGKLRLLRVAPGRSIPEHGHGGLELTLVLRGSFRDEIGRYCRGDVSELDETRAHHPVIDSDGDCISLVASEGPEQFRGLLPRHWQRLRRI